MLFGVVDLARDPHGFLETGLAMYASDAVCLFDASADESVRRRAPYLVPLPPNAEFARFWNEEGSGSAWGILLRSEQTLQKLYDHLRRCLTVEMPDGQPALFRFYDPRVLPAYLRSCDRRGARVVVFVRHIVPCRGPRHRAAISISCSMGTS